MSRGARSLVPTLAAALLLAAVAALGPACATDTRPETWLEAASMAHEAADLALADGHLAEARAELEAVLTMAVPPEVAGTDRRIVLQDVYFRLAEIGLLEGRSDRALASADQGLELGRGRDVFTVNLLVARGRALDDMGEDEAAAAAYYEALQIDDALLQEVLSDAPEEVTP